MRGRCPSVGRAWEVETPVLVAARVVSDANARDALVRRVNIDGEGGRVESVAPGLDAFGGG